MAWLLIFVPLIFAAMALLVPDKRRPLLVPMGGFAHLMLVIFALTGDPISTGNGWLVLDPLGKLVLGFISLLFFLCSLYAPIYLSLRPDRPTRFICACLLAML